MKWQDNEMTIYLNEHLTKWLANKITSTWTNLLMKWPVNEMIVYWNEHLTKWLVN